MKRKTAVKIISFSVFALLIATSLFLKERKTSMKYKQEIENIYSESLNTLNSSVNAINLTLKKTSFVSSAGLLSDYSAKILSETEIAKEALSKLPLDSNGLDTVYKFLSQAGNFSLSVAKSLISGEELKPDQQNNIDTLIKTSEQISYALQETQLRYDNTEFWSKTVGEKLNSISENDLGSSFSELEESLTDYPKLIYDGPFSDHILEKEPLMIKNSPNVSQKEGFDKAKSYFFKESSDLEFDGTQGGKIDCYRFVCKDGVCTVSKSGGYPVYMKKYRTPDKTEITAEKAVIYAENLLESLGFSNMISTYYFTEDDICTVNFAYLDGQTICYTDLIKVGIALDNGEAVMFESSGYLTNHTDRAFEIPSKTAEEASLKIGNNLEIQETSIALIPTESGGEKRCYEFLCKTQNDEEVMLYIDVKDLNTEQVLILLKTDGGTLVK